MCEQSMNLALLIMFCMVLQVWDEANQMVLKMVEEDKDSIAIHPFDHPDVWYVIL